MTELYNIEGHNDEIEAIELAVSVSNQQLASLVAIGQFLGKRKVNKANRAKVRKFHKQLSKSIGGEGSEELIRLNTLPLQETLKGYKMWERDGQQEGAAKAAKLARSEFYALLTSAFERGITKV